jgi:hypothetical protein
VRHTITACSDPILWAEGLPEAKINGRLSAQYENSVCRPGEQPSEIGMETSDIAGQKKKFKTSIICCKSDDDSFWDSQKPILEHYKRGHNSEQ